MFKAQDLTATEEITEEVKKQLLEDSKNTECYEINRDNYNGLLRIFHKAGYNVEHIKNQTIAYETTPRLRGDVIGQHVVIFEQIS